MHNWKTWINLLFICKFEIKTKIVSADELVGAWRTKTNYWMKWSVSLFIVRGWNNKSTTHFYWIKKMMKISTILLHISFPQFGWKATILPTCGLFLKMDLRKSQSFTLQSVSITLFTVGSKKISLQAIAWRIMCSKLIFNWNSDSLKLLPRDGDISH